MLRTKPLRGPRETFRLDRDLLDACMHWAHTSYTRASAVCARARNTAAVGLNEHVLNIMSVRTHSNSRVAINEGGV